ncbi:MAG: DNA cytosine methyltransferase [Hyphomonadaceae bacterium]
MASKPALLEFFAGGGLAGLGLSGTFKPVFANDIDPMKCATYRANFPDVRLAEGDIWKLRAEDLPKADLAWASFPCQDLSLAGARRGLNAPRSGAFWGFWNLMEGLKSAGRPVQTLVLENVCGLMSSHRGRDFAALLGELGEAGYRVGALVLDANHFTAQSRPRLFVVAHLGRIPEALVADGPDPILHPPTLRTAVDALPHETRLAWVWWKTPPLPRRNADLLSVVEASPAADVWFDDAGAARMLAQMSPLHRERLEAAQAGGGRRVGAVYRRIRTENGEKVQRAEVRYDGLAGCLRTPAGGSSRQFLAVSERGKTRFRPLLSREAARLMGCPESYVLPARETAALKVLGDGVCVPAVRWLGQALLAPLAGVRGEGAAGNPVDAAA